MQKNHLQQKINLYRLLLQCCSQKFETANFDFNYLEQHARLSLSQARPETPNVEEFVTSWERGNHHNGDPVKDNKLGVLEHLPLWECIVVFCWKNTIIDYGAMLDH